MQFMYRSDHLGSIPCYPKQRNHIPAPKFIFGLDGGLEMICVTSRNLIQFIRDPNRTSYVYFNIVVDDILQKEPYEDIINLFSSVIKNCTNGGPLRRKIVFIFSTFHMPIDLSFKDCDVRLVYWANRQLPGAFDKLFSKVVLLFPYKGITIGTTVFDPVLESAFATNKGTLHRSIGEIVLSMQNFYFRCVNTTYPPVTVSSGKAAMTVSPLYRFVNKQPTLY